MLNKNLHSILKLFTGSELRRRISGNIIWLFADRIVQLGLNFFISVWVARYLGPEKFGTYNYAFAFVAMFTPLCQLGLESVVIREFTKNKERKDELFSTTIVIRLVSSMVTYLLIVGFVHVFYKNQEQYVLVLITGAMLFANVIDVFDYWFKSQVQAKFSVYSRTFSTLITSGLKVLAITTVQDVAVFVYITISGYYLYNLGVMLIFFRKNKTKFIPSIKCAKALLRDSWPLILSAFSIIFYMRIDQIMIGNMLNNSELGKYSVSTRIAEAFYIIPLILSTTLLPVIVKLQKQDPVSYDNSIKKYFTFNVIFALFVGIVTVISSKLIFNLLYGNDYSGASEIFNIYVWANIFVFLGVARGNVMIVSNQNMFSFYTTFAGAILNILLNLFLIPKYGVKGAAFATVMSQIMAVYVSTLFFKNTRKVFIQMTEALFFPIAYPFNMIKKLIQAR